MQTITSITPEKKQELHAELDGFIKQQWRVTADDNYSDVVAWLSQHDTKPDVDEILERAGGGEPIAGILTEFADSARDDYRQQAVDDADGDRVLVESNLPSVEAFAAGYAQLALGQVGQVAT